MALAGNHVLIDCGQAIVALCHLHFGSVTVSPGQQVQASDTLGRCGISGNSTELHLHIQATDDVEVSRVAHVQWLMGLLHEQVTVVSHAA